MFEIIAGSYEEFLLGYTFSTGERKLAQTFAAHDHSSSLRSVSAGGTHLASGAADDRIIVYDLKERKVRCMLTHHESTVNCLQFTDNQSHIISGSADGTLSIVRLGNWQLEKVWTKAHKGSAILDIAVHASGKLLLSLGADATLKTWNLVKGRQAFAVNLKSKSKDARSLEKIVWCPDDVHFILYGGKFVEIWSIESGGIVKYFEQDEKVTSCIWLDNDKILIGLEDGNLVKLNTENEKKKVIQAHSARVKSLSQHRDWLVSISSSGQIKVWDKKLKELCKEETGCRLTCLCIVPIMEIKKEESEDSDIEEACVEVVKPLKATVKITTNSDGDETSEDEQQTVTKPAGKKRGKKEIKKQKKKRVKK